MQRNSAIYLKTEERGRLTERGREEHRCREKSARYTKTEERGRLTERGRERHKNIQETETDKERGELNGQRE